MHKNDEELKRLRKIIPLNRISTYKNRFVVRVGSKLRLLDVNDIECFFSNTNTTYLRAKSFDYILNASLLSLKEELDPDHFFKANRSFIVNKGFIATVAPYRNNRLKLCLKSYHKSEIIVSREKVKYFKIWFDKPV